MGNSVLAVESTNEAPPLLRHRFTPRVLIDARKLGHGGIGSYIANLVAGLVHSDPDSEVTLVVGNNSYREYAWHNRVRAIFDSAKPYSVDEFIGLPRRIDFSQYDLFHEPHYTLPFGIPIPSVVTVHDLIHVTHPQRFFYPLIARRLIASSVKRASCVIAVSEATGRDLASYLAVTPETQKKIVIVPNTVDPELMLQAQLGRESELVQSIFARGPYLIAIISTDKPHKGLIDLLVAYSHLRRIEVRVPRLVIAGLGVDFRSVTECAVQLGIGDELTIAGALPRAELCALLHQSRGCIVPSLAEGFGLPVLEAQTLSIPVVMRPVAALCELATHADIVAEDFSIGSLAIAMREILRVERISAADRARHLARYAPEQVNELVLNAYASALRRARGGSLN